MPVALGAVNDAEVWVQPGADDGPPDLTVDRALVGKSTKFSEFRRCLQERCARFEEGNRHTKIYSNGKQTARWRHCSQDMGETLRRNILGQLGVKQKGK